MESYSKLGGGAFYVETSTGNSTIRISDSQVVNSKTELYGGFLYAKSSTGSTTSCARLLLDSGARLTASTAKKAGGGAYMAAVVSNEISVIDQAKVSGGESTEESGGIAYMAGKENYLLIYNGALASQCSAKRGGCFHMTGTLVNSI
jgi:hypothetical protein